ncbi:hypothetical protein [Candidatus Leptofilum sp.]
MEAIGINEWYLVLQLFLFFVVVVVPVVVAVYLLKRNQSNKTK